MKRRFMTPVDWSLEKRLDFYTDTSGGPDACWPWQGVIAKTRRGYGKLWFSGRDRLAHRVAWEMFHDRSIPHGMCVCHTCDNPPCCNPAHLFVATSAENTADKVRKGRQARHPGSRNQTSKLTEEQVAAIRKDPRNQYEIAADYGVQQPAISRIKNGLRWRGIQLRDAANPSEGTGT